MSPKYHSGDIVGILQCSALGMDNQFVTPEQYLRITGADYRKLAEVCCCSYASVKSWFSRSPTKRRNPPDAVCKLLALELELAQLKQSR